MGDNKVNNGREINPSLALKEGDVFVQSWIGVVNPLKFKVLNVNRQENKITVDCISHTGYSHTETWDDLDVTEFAFDTGEYRLITEQEYAEQILKRMREFATLPNLRDHVKLLDVSFKFASEAVSCCTISKEEFEKIAKEEVVKKLILAALEQGKIHFIMKPDSITGSLILVDPQTFK